MNKNIWRSVALLALSASVSVAFADTSTPPATQPVKHHHVKKVNPLALTADQKAQIKTIRADAKKEHAAIAKDKSLSSADKKAKVAALNTETTSKIEAVYTPEQQSAMAAKHHKKSA